VPQDDAAAASWFRKAAAQGEAAGQFNLGILYAHGRGVPLDVMQAYKWFELASLRYDSSDKERRENAVRNRDMAAAKMTPAQIAEAQKLARAWKPGPDGGRP
jgi:TPR repeat protein